MIDHKEIKKKLTTLAKKIDAPKNLLPPIGHVVDQSYPFIEVGKKYYLKKYERGREIVILETDDQDLLLFEVFSIVTKDLSAKWELVNRKENEDPRRQVFMKQRELISRLDENWERQISDRQIEILKEFPFDDDAIVRVRMNKSLLETGYNKDEAWAEACKRFPLP